ncbi:unnamed protein product, partial [Brassica oleracea var. botrytis]
ENQSGGVNLQEVATKHLKGQPEMKVEQYLIGVSGLPSAGVDVNVAVANILVLRLNHSLNNDERAQWRRKRRETPAVTR